MLIDENVCNELIYAISPYIDEKHMSDVRMRVIMCLSKYDISKAETHIVPYQGDVNEEILKRFLIAKTARGLSKRTLNYYSETIKATLARIGKPYTQINANDIRLYMAYRVNVDKVSKTTANNERRNLSAFFTWLQKEEILLKNPMAKVEPIKETKKKKKAFTPMEVEKIRAACRDEYEKALIEVLLSTWCRVSEVAEMKKGDIDGGKVLVHGKGDKYREVFLTSRAQLAIESFLKKRTDKSAYLFPKGQTLDHIRQSEAKNDCHLWWMDPNNIVPEKRDTGAFESTVRKIGKRAEVENVHPHRFRRTGATRALLSGMPLMEVSKVLGHENVGTTQIYIDIDTNQLHAAHERYVN